jgi:hypothetical protein
MGMLCNPAKCTFVRVSSGEWLLLQTYEVFTLRMVLMRLIHHCSCFLFPVWGPHLCLTGARKAIKVISLLEK